MVRDEMGMELSCLPRRAPGASTIATEEVRRGIDGEPPLNLCQG